MAAEASFIYPVNGSYNRVVNVIDTIQIAYESQWSALNLSVHCLTSPTGTNQVFHNIDSNPILANGTYTIFGIAGFRFPINQYPTFCNYHLIEYKNNSNQVVGALFNLTSTSGAVKTFSYTPTGTSTIRSQSATITATSVGTTTGGTTRSTSSGTATASAAAASTTTSTSTSTPSATTAPSGLSTGAKAGIGVGVALGVVLIFALLGFFALRRRKQKKNTVTSPANPLPSAAPAYVPQMSDKNMAMEKEKEDESGRAELPIESTSSFHEVPAGGDAGIKDRAELHVPPIQIQGRAELP